MIFYFLPSNHRLGNIFCCFPTTFSTSKKDIQQNSAIGEATFLGVWRVFSMWDFKKTWRQGYEDVSGDLVVHVELRKWADVALVAPCSANTLSKMALGLCDTCPTNWGQTMLFRISLFCHRLPSILKKFVRVLDFEMYTLLFRDMRYVMHITIYILYIYILIY